MKEVKFIDPKSDYGFKVLFGTVANKELTIGFLNSLLDKQIKDITFQNVEMLGENSGNTKVIFDLFCETEDGECFIVEIQKKKQQYFSDRVLYYASFVIQRQAQMERKRIQTVFGKGKKRWEYRFSKVYVVCFLDFIMDTRYPEKYRWDIVRMDRELKEPFSETLNEIYLELPKFKLDFSECDTPYKRFLYILNHVEIMGEIPKHIWENDNFLKKLKSAVEVERMSLDERLAYELSLSVERDWYACMEYRYEEGVEKGKQEGKQAGLEEGLIKGKQEGKLEGLYQTATNLKKSGIDLQTIADCTGLTLEEVEKL